MIVPLLAIIFIFLSHHISLSFSSCSAAGYKCCSARDASCQVAGGSIGKPGSARCYCDPTCYITNDCCLDYATICTDGCFYNVTQKVAKTTGINQAGNSGDISSCSLFCNRNSWCSGFNFLANLNQPERCSFLNVNTPNTNQYNSGAINFEKICGQCYYIVTPKAQYNGGYPNANSGDTVASCSEFCTKTNWCSSFDHVPTRLPMEKCHFHTVGSYNSKQLQSNPLVNHYQKICGFPPGPNVSPDDSDLNKTLSLPMQFYGEAINLTLAINGDIPHNLPITILDTNTMVIPSVNPIGAYYDEANKASMIVTFVKNETKLMMGSIIKNDTFYTLFQTNQYSSDVNINGVSFKVFTENLTTLSNNNCFLKNKMQSYFDSSNQPGQQAEFNSTLQTYTIELSIFTDVTIYDRFLDIFNCARDNQCSSYVQGNLTNYIFLMANLVSLRFFNIDSESLKFQLRIKLNNISIITNSLNKETQIISNEGKKSINGTEIYQTFNSFVTMSGKREALFKSDHYMLITNCTIYHDNFFSNLYTGYTKQGGICKLSLTSPESTSSTSIVRDRGLFATVITMAHELAHNLGALHDTDAIKGCALEDQYIMAPNISNLNKNNIRNLYYFSQCSINDLSNFLPNNEVSCLQRIDGKLRDQNITEFDTKYDLQCQIYTGSSTSRFCQGNLYDICYQMGCLNSATGKCFYSDELRAIDNTTCNINSKCYRGKCLKSSFSINCYFNDTIGMFEVSGDSQYNCRKLNYSSEHYRCYNSTIYNYCCKTCDKIKTGPPQCLYGNQDIVNCVKPNGQYNPNCYNDDYKQRCCAYCNNTISEPPGCLYGDRYEGCASTLNSNKNACLDTTFRDNCCLTCINFFIKPTPSIVTQSCQPTFTRTALRRLNGGTKNSISTIDGCAKACINQYDCVGFDINFKETPNECWLLTNTGQLSYQDFWDHYDMIRSPTSCSTNVPCGETFTKTALRHMVGGTKNDRTTVDTCKNSCVLQASCIGFDFNFAETPNQCWLLSKISNLYSSNDVDHYDINRYSTACSTPDPCKPTFAKTQYRHVSGGTKNGETTVEGCMSACIIFASCVGFDFNFVNTPNECWLLTNNANPVFINNADHYEMNRYPTTCNLFTVSPCQPTFIKTAFYHMVGGTKNLATTVEACKSSCISQTSCVGFDFNFLDTPNQCWLLDKLTEKLYTNYADHYQLIRKPSSC